MTFEQVESSHDLSFTQWFDLTYHGNSPEFAIVKSGQGLWGVVYPYFEKNGISTEEERTKFLERVARLNRLDRVYMKGGGDRWTVHPDQFLLIPIPKKD